MSARELTTGGSVGAGGGRDVARWSTAATLMGVSYRQAKRLYRRYRAEGAGGAETSAARDAGPNRATAARDAAAGAGADPPEIQRAMWTSGSARRWRPSTWRARTG